MKMNRWLSAILLVQSSLLAQGSFRENSDIQVRAPMALIDNVAVARVVILHLPDSTMTRVALTPQAFLSIADSRFEMTSDIKERLGPAFSGMSIQIEKQIPDLRWGLLFYDMNNREIGSIFVDKFGQYGYMNQEPGSFKPDHLGSNLVKELHRITGDLR
jgi:hypothetical protein